MSELPRSFLSCTRSERLGRLEPYLRFLASRRFYGREADGSDCVQRSLIKIDQAWRSPERAPNAGNDKMVFGWAGVIFRREAATMDRERKRQERDRAGNHGEGDGGGASGGPGLVLEVVEGSHTPPPIRVEREELLARLAESLDRLTHLEREAVRLKFFEDRTAAEIARELNLTNANERAARDLVYRALTKLRNDRRLNPGDSR